MKCISQVVPYDVSTSTVVVVTPRNGSSTMKCNVATGISGGDTGSGGVRSLRRPAKTASDRQYFAQTGTPYSPHVQARTAFEEMVRQASALRRRNKHFIFGLLARLGFLYPQIAQMINSRPRHAANSDSKEAFLCDR